MSFEFFFFLLSCRCLVVGGHVVNTLYLSFEFPRMAVVILGAEGWGKSAA
jgi:hypothetical protein